MSTQGETKAARKPLLSPSTRENLRIYKYKFSRNKLSVFGLVLVLLSFFFAIFAEVIVPHPESIGSFVDYANASLPPCKDYLFGTDQMGRDVFSRVIFSFRGALIMSIVVLAISVPVGTVLGLLAGYYHGTKIDAVIMRISDVFLSVPSLILALCVASILEPNMMNSMLAVTIMWWPWYTRLVYSQASSISEEYFVKNAELIGASKAHILFREILPNCLSPIFTKMALDVGWVILMGASLSFVGLGEQPPTPAFGQMISDGAALMPDIWWLTIFPAAGIAFMILVSKDGIDDKIREILQMVELPPDFMYKTPNSIGGGERQLVSIARALCSNPKFIILDEPTSSLDVSIQAKILNMLMKLKEEQKLTYMFITHDMGVMRNVSTKIAIMYLGKICEIAPTKTFYEAPMHPYTQMLLSAIPVVTPEEEALKPKKVKSEGEIPSPVNIPSGCSFHTRCAFKQKICMEVDPEMQEVEPGHFVRCHLCGKCK